MRHVISLAITGALLGGCGDIAEFRGSTVKNLRGAADQIAHKDLDASSVDGRFVDRDYMSLAWAFDCGVPSGDQERDMFQLVVDGSGEHALGSDTSEIAVSVSMQGRYCQPQERERDVTVVIDTSATMDNGSGGGNDPLRSNGRCGRLDALDELMAQLPSDGSSTLTVVTFDAAPAEWYQAPYTDRASWMAGLERSSATTLEAHEIICDGFGTTDYDAALRKAKLLMDFNNGRAKELFFISDGLPNPVELDGIAVAEELKSQNTFIGTIMLAGDDTKLRQLASPRTDGGLYHAKVNQASDLIRAIRDLGDAEISNAVMKYRLEDHQDWRSFDVLKYSRQQAFTLPTIYVVRPNLQTYMEVSFELEDTSGVRFTRQGRVDW